MRRRSSATVRSRASRGCTSTRGSAAWASTRGSRSGSTSGSHAAGGPFCGPRNPIGYGMCGPTVHVWGSEAQKRRYLRPLFTNEEIWCQLFSEPGSGSDFAGLSSTWRARRRRVDRQRPEGLDHPRARVAVGSAGGAHRHRGGQARRPHRVRRRHARAHRRGAAAAPDDRRGRVQRGLLHRHPDPGRRDARQAGRRMARLAHHADERAHIDRRQHPPPRFGHDRRADEGVGDAAQPIAATRRPATP